MCHLHFLPCAHCTWARDPLQPLRTILWPSRAGPYLSQSSSKFASSIYYHSFIFLALLHWLSEHPTLLHPFLHTGWSPQPPSLPALTSPRRRPSGLGPCASPSSWHSILVTPSSLIPLNTTYRRSSPKRVSLAWNLSLEFKMYTSNCLLGISIWMPHSHAI